MAGFKHVFLFCSVILMALNVQAYPKTEIEAVQAEGIIGVITDVLRALEQVLDSLLASVEGLVEWFSTDNWNALQQQTVNATRTWLRPVVDQILDDVDKMANQSTATSKKVAACLRSAGDDILEVPVSFWDGASKCFGDDLVVIVQAVGQVVKDLEGVEGDLKAATDKLAECPDTAAGLQCALDALLDMVHIVNELPAKVEESVAALDADLAALGENIEKCVNDQVPVYYTNAGKVLDKVGSCVLA